VSPAWEVGSTAHPHLTDLDSTSATPEEAARAAGLWNLDADGGSWFAGGIATIEVKSSAGERWSCVATMVSAPERVTLTPMVLTFASAAEKSVALARSAIRFAKQITALASEPETAKRGAKSAALGAAFEAERARIESAPCRPMRPSFHAGCIAGRGSPVQVLQRDP